MHNMENICVYFPGFVAFAKDYCNSDMFRPRCASRADVIVMRNATFGRMETGTCVKMEFGFVGCAADVMSILDSRCSGRRACDVRVADPHLENASSCNPEMKSYLSAEFDCISSKQHIYLLII